ncbi:kinase-like domain-containing protein, partial [Dipodascopsis uninucleata]
MVVTSSATSLSLTDRFELIRPLGDGSFGSVTLARVRPAGPLHPSASLQPGLLVAVKSLKKAFANSADYLRLRELRLLRALPPSRYLTRAYEIFLDLTSGKLHIIMEYMHMNMYQYLNSRAGRRLSAVQTASILEQIALGIQHIHVHGFFHRDIKPENVLVLVSADGITPPVVKLTDFGLVREIDSSAPYTTYVSTRWYRAPEILLKAGFYGPEVDIWAFACMAVEVALLKPIVPGKNEFDQLLKVCHVMGTPDLNDHGSWEGRAYGLAAKIGINLPRGISGCDFSDILRSDDPSENTINMSLGNLVSGCFSWNPETRLTCDQVLAHVFFTNASSL